MPVSMFCSYAAPWWLPGGDLQTIGARIFCFIPQVPFVRERIELTDGDFIVIDKAFASKNRSAKSDKIAVLSHGLEGDSRRSYMRSMALVLLRRGWDVAARNFRGCGGENNRLPVLYHSGDGNDLDSVVTWAVNKGYTEIALVGFSMGGNQVLKYLGERSESLSRQISAAGVVSVPCDLAESSEVLSQPGNAIYMQYFLRTLRQKIRQKHKTYPDLFPIKNLNKIKNFKEFDNRYTAPLHGFYDARDYWEKASCKPFLRRIKTPAMIINACNDPFLRGGCYPVTEAKGSDFVYLLTPKQGGHVGFPTWAGKTIGWLENTIADFLEQHSLK